MDFTPPFAKVSQMLTQRILDATNFLPVEAIGFAQFCRSFRTIQNEHGFTARPDDMNVSRAVIARVDHHP